jgi:cytochrome P450
MVLYMVEYPDVQERIHQEIIECFGLNGTISLQDEYRLPIIRAAIDEIGRHSPAAAIGVPRMAEKDIILDGHLIPKGKKLLFLNFLVKALLIS